MFPIYGSKETHDSEQVAQSVAGKLALSSGSCEEHDNRAFVEQRTGRNIRLEYSTEEAFGVIFVLELGRAIP